MEEQALEQLKKTLDFLQKAFDKSPNKAGEWSNWSKQKVDTITWEELEILSNQIANTLCNIEGKADPWWMRGWMYLSALSCKQVEEMCKDTFEILSWSANQSMQQHMASGS